MDEKDRAFGGTVPEVYDRLLVPLIFEDCARDLAGRLDAASGEVLETAAGSGVLTRVLAGRLGPGARITATDLNPAMLERAQSRSGDPRIAWRAADALDLPFDDGRFDAVLCQFGVMFFPDRVRGYAEARRVLRPDGRFLFNIWDGLATNGLAASVDAALRALWPDDPPAFLARTPYAHGAPDTIRAELTAAGFADVEIDPVEFVSRAPDALTAATAFCQGTPLRADIEARGPDALGQATEHAARRIAKDWGDGPVEAPIRAFVAEAR